MLFELLLAGVSPPGYSPTTDHPPHGRLVSFKGLHGRNYDVTYKTWTPAETTASPERQCKIDTISDTLGQTISIDYYTTQQDGDWVIETITHSITALTDGTGSIVERYAYDAYGGLSVFDGAGASRSATAEGNRYTYTGREWNGELELYHYRARMHDAVAGRFLSRVPIGYVDGFSLYCSYFVMDKVDPTGRENEDCCDKDINSKSCPKNDTLLLVTYVAKGERVTAKSDKPIVGKCGAFQ